MRKGRQADEATRFAVAAKMVATAMVATTIVATLSGCAQTKNWLSSVRLGPAASAEEAIILGAPEADQYLAELYDLAAGDPATQAEIFADARAAARLTPNPSTELRYALVLATPGHSEENAQEAQALLRELLAQTELMTAAEISLATIHLRSVEQRIVLESEARRLRRSSSRQQQTREAAVNQRIATVEAENLRLRRELDDAENKLEAITTIERSIREQGE